MVTLADALSVNKDEDIYRTSAWASQREKYEGYNYWYSGKEWERYIPDIRDQATGERVRQWPLRLNPIAKNCRIHRACLMGMQPETITTLPVQTLVIRKDSFTDEQKKAAIHLQDFVERVWLDSNGISSQYRAGLLMQVYGGHVFKVAWCPWEKRWPHRIGIQSFNSPAVYYPAVYSAFDPWLLYEAYIGYMISSDEAQTVYGITPKGDAKETLYLEHWTRDTYRFTVDGTVPVMEWNGREFRLEGENPWGIVPIVYVPHDPSGEYYGRSLVDGESSLVGLAKEYNARMADKGEFVQDTRPMLVGRNMRASGGFKLRDVLYRGSAAFQILDIGDTKSLPGSREPDIFVVQSNGLPRAEAAYPDEIRQALNWQGDIASVATGDDDVSGGRITGPVTAYRMWPTMQHTMAERSYITVGLSHIAGIVARIAQEREASGVYAELGIEPPGITEEMLELGFGASWRPMIPIEESKNQENLNARLQAGGISLYSYLAALSVQDPETEVERIFADRARQAEIDAIVERARGEAQAGMSADTGKSQERGNPDDRKETRAEDNRPGDNG